MKRESSKEFSVSFLWANESFSLWSCSFEEFNLVFFTADGSAWLVFNQPRKQGFWRNLRYILNTLLYLQRFYKTFSTFLHRRERKPQNVHSNLRIGHLHDGVILLLRPESFSFFFSYLNLVHRPSWWSPTSPTRAKNPVRAPCPWSNLYIYARACVNIDFVHSCSIGLI